MFIRYLFPAESFSFVSDIKIKRKKLNLRVPEKFNLNKFSNLISIPTKCFLALIDSRLQIRRMQDILAQMQEKLKATGQVGGGGGLRGRVGSLGNDLDSADVEKKRNSIIDV